jgi:pimeloyl-ACP methyl ester carboxylesterase
VLADVATFIRTMNRLNNDTNPRWVLFGGSYLGTIAAAMRVRYPDLTVGAVASSAPMQAVTDFYSYKQFVESRVNMYGNSQCMDGVRQFFYAIQTLMKTKPGRFTVKQAMCLFNDWHEFDYIDEKDVEVGPSSFVLKCKDSSP